jgi:ATP-dependent Clp protease adaptor protein ClpS
MNNNNDPLPEFDEQAIDAATAVEEATNIGVRVRELPKNLTKGQRPHVVIVYNDEEHSFEFVILVLMEVCKMSQDEAIEAALMIHDEGKAPVFSGLLEVCELKRDQIATFRDELAIQAGAPNLPLNVVVAEA